MNRIKNNGLFWFTFLLLVCISFPVSASTDAKQGEVDVQDIVFSHQGCLHLAHHGVERERDFHTAARPAEKRRTRMGLVPLSSHLTSW